MVLGQAARHVSHFPPFELPHATAGEIERFIE
jgi:hypothetical protein